MGLFQTDLFNALMFFSDLFGKLGYIVFNGVVIFVNVSASFYVFMNFFDWYRGHCSLPLRYYVSEIDKHIKAYPSGDVINIVIHDNGSSASYYFEFSKDAGTYSTHVHATDVGKVLHYLCKTYPKKKFEIRDMFKNKLSV
jgi:hypothetical protein